MSIVKSINAQPATGAAAMWQLISLLVSQAGWSKTKDSDGTTLSASGTQVTSGGSGANGLENDRAWVLLRAPDSSLYVSIQHRNNASNRNWRIKCSTVAPTGGSATQVPTASDDAIYAGGGTDASPTFTDEVIGESDGSSYWAFSVASTTAPYVFCLWTWADNALPLGYISSLICLDSIQPWTRVTGDTFPYVLHAVTVGSGNDTASLATMSQPDPGTSRTAPWTWLAKGTGSAGFVLMPMSGRANVVTDPIAPGNVPLNPVTNKHDLLPIEYCRASDAPTNPKGFKGWSTLFSWRPLSTHVTGDMYSVDSTGDNLVLSDLVLNLWANDTALGTGGSPTTRLGRIFTAPSSDSTAPLVSNISPSPGTVLTPSTHVSFDVTDNLGGLRRVLVGVTANGLYTREMPHDGTSFAANYTGSTRTSITNGFHYDLIRAGGFPSFPTITVYPTDTSGNEA